MKRIIVVVFITLALMVISVQAVRYSTRKYIFAEQAVLPAASVAVIFGAGYGYNGMPSKYMQDRLDAGIALLNSGKVQKLLLSGDNGSKMYDELFIMKKYCRQKNVDTTKIFVDYAGFDTYSTLYRAKHIFHIRDAVLVSQSYHLPRAVYTSRRLGIASFGFSANRGEYYNYQRNKVREYLATVKAVIEILIHRKPKYLGPAVDINGPSNYTQYTSANK